MVFSERVESICRMRNRSQNNMKHVKEGSSEAYYLAGHISAFDTALVALGVNPRYEAGYVVSYEIRGFRKPVTS